MEALSYSRQFRLDDHLEKLYRQAARPLAMKATTIAAFNVWKAELRAAVLKLLGIAGRKRPRPAAQMLREIDCGKYVEQKWSLDVGEGAAAPMYLLVPKTPPPWKPILVVHGHNASAQTMLGHSSDQKTRAADLAIDDNYAQAPAEAGYFVCALEQRGFGERLSRDVEPGGWTCTDRHMAFFLQMMGRTLIGERCHDAMCAIDYLLTRDDLVKGTLGMTGNSGGGTTTLWTAALDERIACPVTSCYLCSFKASIMDITHCECNYVPGIAALCEMGDIAAMIAPRAAMFIAGEKDTIFPIAAVREQFATVQKAYDLLKASDRCKLAVHEGPHAYKHAFAQEWFVKHL
ncbi:MAG: alpha/beta hydrolase family protein [Planctomycetaceae bacterium]